MHQHVVEDSIKHLRRKKLEGAVAQQKQVIDGDKDEQAGKDRPTRQQCTDSSPLLTRAAWTSNLTMLLSTLYGVD